MFRRISHRPTTYRQKAGRRAEQLALQFLIDQGLEHVESNYRCRLGELDLVMRDAGQLVFVEVRYRSRDDFGGAAASVGPVKQSKLRAAAQCYLQQRTGGENCPCRFDVVTYSGAGRPQDVDWIKDAF